jgi:hypothetical protein
MAIWMEKKRRKKRGHRRGDRAGYKDAILLECAGAESRKQYQPYYAKLQEAAMASSGGEGGDTSDGIIELMGRSWLQRDGDRSLNAWRGSPKTAPERVA